MADKTTSSIAIAVPREAVMTVIADFDAYPQWATGVRSTEVLAREPDGRANRVRFQLDAGMIRDSYVLGYDWDGDRRSAGSSRRQVRWSPRCLVRTGSLTRTA